MSSYLITGAARGIGFEFVRNLSSANTENTIFALVRSLSNSQRLSELQLEAKNIYILQADITDVAALKIAAAAVHKITGGSLDYIINNGAFIEPDRRNNNLDGYPEGQEDILEKDLTDSFRVNVVGVVHTINTFLPLVRKGTAKKVITISSSMADVDFALQTGLSNQAPYSISKAAVNMVVAKYAAEYKTEGLVFVAVCPGLVDTAATARTTPKQVEEYEELMVNLRTFKPGFEGAITPEKSVSMLLGLVYKWTVEDTGSFVSHYGNKDWL